MDLRIAVIVGTTRPERFSEKPAHFLFELAKTRGDLTPVLLDLREHPLPFFAEAAPLSRAPAQTPAAVAWGKLIAGFDGFAIVTGEYNHGIPAVLKNSLDYALAEWARKPAAFFGYGGVGAARAIEHLRGVCIELQMVPVPAAVHLCDPIFTSLSRGEKTFADYPFFAQAATRLLDQLVWLARALKTAREAGQAAGA